MASQIMKAVNQFGEKPQAFIVEHVMKIMGMPEKESSKSALRREVGKLVASGDLEKNGNCISEPFMGGEFNESDF